MHATFDHIFLFFCYSVSSIVSHPNSRKARIGLAHILMYKDKHKEFLEVYKMKDDHTEIHFNPKDKDFIYFWEFLPHLSVIWLFVEEYVLLSFITKLSGKSSFGFWI